MLHVLVFWLEDKGEELTNSSSACVDDVGLVLFAEDKVDDDLEE